MIRSDGDRDLAPRRRPDAGAGRRSGRPWTLPGDPARRHARTRRRERASRPPNVSSGARSKARSRSRGPRRSIPRRGSSSYTYIGPQALDISGYTPEELMVERTHFPRMVHPDDRARVRISVRALRGERASGRTPTASSGATARSAGSIRSADGPQPPGEVPEVWQGVAVDVTASRERRPRRRRRREMSSGRADRVARLADRGAAARRRTWREHPSALGQVRVQLRRDLDAAVGALVVLHDRDQRPADRRGGAVQRVEDLDVAARRAAPASASAAPGSRWCSSRT